jgi:hypothetical protein
MDLARNLIGRINVGDSLIQKNVVRSEHARHYQEG